MQSQADTLTAKAVISQSVSNGRKRRRDGDESRFYEARQAGIAALPAVARDERKSVLWKYQAVSAHEHNFIWNFSAEKRRERQADTGDRRQGIS